MKKIAHVLVVVMVIAFVFSCASPAPDAARADYPDFVLNPPLATDAIYGVGYGKQSTMPLSIRLAETNARTDIANQLSTTIQSSVVSYMQEAGVDDDTQYMSFVEEITRSVTDQSLEGTRTQRREIMDDGAVWVLMALDQNALLRNFEEAAQQFERSEAAAFAEFKADQALQRLDHQLKSDPSQSQPVTE